MSIHEQSVTDKFCPRPKCGSPRPMWKAGSYYDKYGEHARYQCPDCHKITIHPLDWPRKK
jgi:transposase-like protein